MNGLEIRNRIDYNNKIIGELMTPNFFTLNNTVADLLAENRKLQDECSHEFFDGFCIFCDKLEEEEEDK